MAILALVTEGQASQGPPLAMTPLLLLATTLTCISLAEGANRLEAAIEEVVLEGLEEAGGEVVPEERADLLDPDTDFTIKVRKPRKGGKPGKGGGHGGHGGGHGGHGGQGNHGG